MAKIAELDEKIWNEWIQSRPKTIQELCKKVPPDRLYRLQQGSRVTIHSYDEDGTVTVNVCCAHNFLFFERQVFGINPDELSECDLPDDDEITGVIFS